MVLGNLTYVIDESYIDSLDIVLQESFWENDDESEYKARDDAEDAKNRAEKDMYSANVDLGFTVPDDEYYDLHSKNEEYFKDIKNKIDRICQRSLMSSKNVIDGILIKLKKFAHKLELSPMKKKNANIFQKLKSLIGTAIRKLTNALMKVAGTQNRKGKTTEADKGIRWSAPSDSRIHGEYSPNYIKD